MKRAVAFVLEPVGLKEWFAWFGVGFVWTIDVYWIGAWALTGNFPFSL